ncbi:MAG: NADH-quinone oxidoreductase subunit N [Deltaproteobacteria bacterium]|nr:NADH-quinone oxidoreductase subunit N [Deltaproteobacteria bacterium]
MSPAEFSALLPVLILAAAASLLTAVAGFYRKHGFVAGFTMAAFLLSFASLFIASDSAPIAITPLLLVDGFALFFMGLTFAASFAVTLLSYGYNGGSEGKHTEYYILLMLSALGAAVLAESRHFASFFLGLETLSVSLFGLVAYMRTTRGNEAGLKYLVLAGASSAFLVFGMALVYAATGSMEFSAISALAGVEGGAVMAAGMAMIIAGAGFKLAVVPFHGWTPDVYEGAPAPVGAFIASVSKGAVVVALMRLLSGELLSGGPMFIFLTAVAIASMFAGNLLALFQENIKRVLAYSSIAHLGYLLVAFLASGTFAAGAVAFYLAAYFVSIIGAFGVVTVLSVNGSDMEKLESYRGLARRNPVIAAIFTAMLLSLAGIPLTAGFVGKFYLVAAGAASSMWLLVLSLALSSVIGFYYYLRIILVLFAPAPEQGEPEYIHPAGSAALTALFIALIFLGVYPGPFLSLVGAAAAGFGQ